LARRDPSVGRVFSSSARPLDNATGKIMDHGVVKCSNAAEQNLDAWKQATRKDKFVEIPKSFRHEGDPP
jgi:hypothetical protein